MTASTHLILASASLAVLTFVVGLRLLYVRVRDMKSGQISPQKVALSGPKSELLQDTRASDNFSHLFEVPVLFYALCALAVASAQIPGWLPVAAWGFVLSRVIHSYIQCTHNHVMSRFTVFVIGFVLLLVMWLGFAVSWLV